MGRTLILLITTILMMSCQSDAPPIAFPKIATSYPDVKKDTTVVDSYHGTTIADPYRWLEDDHSDETKDWVSDQNDVTFDYLAQIPFRDAIKDRLKTLWDYEKYGVPFKRGEFYYYYKNDGLQNQAVLYRIKDLNGSPELVLDPNLFSEDGTVALGATGYSKDGKYLAYQKSEGGSDWRSVEIMDLRDKSLLDDKVEWIKFSGVSWRGDGFYYSRYPEPEQNDELSAANEYHKLYHHKIGDTQDLDQLIYDEPKHPQRNIYAGTSEDERFLFISIVESTSGNALKLIDFAEANAKPVSIWGSFDSDFSVIDNIGDKLLVSTNYQAPNQKVVIVDPKNPAESNWTTVIPESDDALRGVSIIDNKLFAYYLHNASSKVKVFELDGTFVQDLELPGIGSVSGIQGKKDSDLAFYSFSSYTRPSTIYRLDTKTLKSEVFSAPQIDFNSDDYTTEQIWYKSKDGTKVPMFVTYKKGMVKDGSNPTLLYGYGGFDIPLTPGFAVTRLPLLQNGGIYVVANLRGGGEFGQAWHKAGTLDQKQNVFDDFQAAAEYLIKEGYTSSDKLAIEGGSNGGLLVGASITQRPDLFKVAFPRVGVLDMLRYHEFTIGWAWATDYGRSDDPEAFKYLIEYSPLHNVKKAAYPATMVTTADHDDRVVPAHSFKFISELQDKHIGENPVLIRVETSAGHGAGKSTEKRIEEAADMLSFMFYNMEEPFEFDVKD